MTFRGGDGFLSFSRICEGVLVAEAGDLPAEASAGVSRASLEEYIGRSSILDAQIEIRQLNDELSSIVDFRWRGCVE